LIDLCNRGDVDSLFEGLDETAYELTYALDLERPGAENVLMGITVADPVAAQVLLVFGLTVNNGEPHGGGALALGEE
jgi:hypothetical protein